MIGSERTLVILKPDAVARGLCGEILRRLERVGLKIVAAKMVHITPEFARRHYRSDRTDWVKGLGEKTLLSCQKVGKDPREVFQTDEPLAIGRKVAEFLINYICSGPVVALLWQGNLAVEMARKIAGNTLPLLAAPGTIRGDYCSDSADVANAQGRGLYTLVHTSGNREEAEYEADLWFKPEEIHTYRRADEAAIFGPPH